jgi:hypothetical protein
MVEYFTVDGFSGRYFACARYGTLSVMACARNFEAAPQAIKAGRLEGCVGCSIGALHGGRNHAEIAAVPQASRPRVCVRCRRSGCEADSRLVGRMRLVRGHTICVSCYNREREVVHGANAKGGTPRKWAGLHRPRTARVCRGRTIVGGCATPLVDRGELVLTLMREADTSGVVFAALPIGSAPRP